MTRSAGQASTQAVDSITHAAHTLAVNFTEDLNLPARYRRLKDLSRKSRAINEDSEVEKRFKANVESWHGLIETMLSKIEYNQAWRFINVNPQLVGEIKSISENKDFCGFIDYLILRRDKEKCLPDELGGLALLAVAIQRAIEGRIQR